MKALAATMALLIAAGLSAAPAFAQQPADPASAGRYNQGTRELLAGKPERAVEILKQGMAEAPADLQARFAYNLGLAYAGMAEGKQGEDRRLLLEQAMEMFRAAVIRDPSDEQAKRNFEILRQRLRSEQGQESKEPRQQQEQQRQQQKQQQSQQQKQQEQQDQQKKQQDQQQQDQQQQDQQQQQQGQQKQQQQQQQQDQQQGEQQQQQQERQQGQDQQLHEPRQGQQSQPQPQSGQGQAPRPTDREQPEESKSAKPQDMREAPLQEGEREPQPQPAQDQGRAPQPSPEQRREEEPSGMPDRQDTPAVNPQESSQAGEAPRQEMLWILDAMRQEERMLMRPLYDPEEIESMPEGPDW